MAEKFDLEAQKSKIAAMLAKADRTDNEHERDAYTKKAEAMMIRLGIDAAELEAAGEVKPEQIGQMRTAFFGVYMKPLIQMAADVAAGFGHIRILQATNSSGYYLVNGERVKLREHIVCFAIGTETDVEQFMQLLESLKVQVESARKRFAKEQAPIMEMLGMTARDKYNASYTFIVEFGTTVRRRLMAQRQTEEATASAGAALVLVGKADRVNEVADALSSGRVSKSNIAERFEALGALGGREAGRTAHLGEKSLGTDTAGTLG